MRKIIKLCLAFVPMLLLTSCVKNYNIVIELDEYVLDKRTNEYVYMGEKMTYDVRSRWYTNNAKEVERIEVLSEYNGRPVTKIHEYAFRSSQAKEIILPDTIKEIGKCAFANSKIEEIVIPDSVEILGDCVFDSCDDLHRIVLSKNLKSVGIDLFRMCDEIYEIDNCQDESLVKDLHKAFVFSTKEKQGAYLEKNGFMFYIYQDECYVVSELNDYAKSLNFTVEYNSKVYDSFILRKCCHSSGLWGAESNPILYTNVKRVEAVGLPWGDQDQYTLVFSTKLEYIDEANLQLMDHNTRFIYLGTKEQWKSVTTKFDATCSPDNEE